MLSCSVLFNSVLPWTVACQAPLSMEFPRQEYWSGLPFPSPGDLPNPGIKPRSPALQAEALTSEQPGKPILWHAKSLQLCPTLCDPVDCILSGSSIHGIFQAGVLEWIAIAFSRGSFKPRDQTQVTQSQRKAMPENAQTTAQLHSSHTLAK